MSIKNIMSLVMLLCMNVEAEQKAMLPKELPFKVAELKNVQLKTSDSPATELLGKLSHRISGQITAKSKSSLSFRVPGFIDKIVVKPGQVVKKGELLALLDKRDYELQLKIAEANKKQAQLQEEVAKNEFNREKELKDAGASTGSEFDQIQFKYKQAQVGVELADLSLKIAQQNLEHAKLKAPYHCVVALQHKDQAERVGAETPVFEIYEANSSEVCLDAPEVLMGKLKVGGNLAFQVPSVGFRGEATITHVVPVVQENTRTFRVKAMPKNQDPRVVPGLFAEAQIIQVR